MLPEEIKAKAALSPAQLKREVLPTDFEFETTEDVPELSNIVGQERAEKVMKFGLSVNKKGYNIYVAGKSGIGKSTFTDTIVAEFAKKNPELHDWLYVYNFEDSYRPQMLKLPVGMGKQLKEEMTHLIEDLREDIPKAFSEETYHKERTRIINEYKNKSDKVIQVINSIAKGYNFIVQTSGGGIITVPVFEGKPITEDQYQKLDQQTLKQLDDKSLKLQEEIYDYIKQLRKLETEMKYTLSELNKKVADVATAYHIEELQEKFATCQNVIDYLANVKNDIIKNIKTFLPQKEEEKNENPLMEMLQRGKTNSFPNKYEINLLIDNSETKGAPIVKADNPTYYNLIGKVEYESRMGMMSTDFTKIKPGYLHHANGGYLIIQAKDFFSKNYAWDGLKQALLNERIQIENLGEHSGMLTTASLKSDPIPLDLKVVLIGNFEIYQMLYQVEEDFSKLFKVKADFDVEMDFNLENMSKMASFIHTHCKQHGLLAFDRTAVAKVVEYSIRLTAHQEKLSTQFNHLVEIIYEADTWAGLMNDELVSESHIIKAIEEREYRSSLYEEKIQDNIKEGTILIDTDGFEVGQVNALSVHQLGQYSFGRPSRITATTFIGRKGIISIARESKMSGNIHNKGVYILSGYLGQTFAQTYPLSLTANLAFEQLYGGIDGDSASAAELYTIISSLADVPIDQGLAVTGSVNQKGIIQPIGGVNEKIEGFFDICKQNKLTGKQGVLIPPQNVKNLMLNDEVIDAIKQGKFHVYEVSTIEEGIAILTGMPAGKLNQDKEYEENTIYRKVTDKLSSFARLTHPPKK